MKREKGSIMVLVLPLITTLILSLGISIYNSAKSTIVSGTTATNRTNSINQNKILDEEDY